MECPPPFTRSFSFLGKSYSSMVLCMNGYASPGTSTQCSYMDLRDALTTASATKPRIALFWADLKTDTGTGLSLTDCTPSVSGQRSRMTWGTSATGSSAVNTLVRRTSGTATFTSSAYFVGTWENIRFFEAGSDTCDRYTFQVVVAKSSASQTYVLMLYTRVPTTGVPEDTFVGLRGSSGALSVWASPTDGADTAASVLGSGSNVGLAGLRVYRVDGSTIVQPAPAASPPSREHGAAQRCFIHTCTAILTASMVILQCRPAVQAALVSLTASKHFQQ